MFRERSKRTGRRSTLSVRTHGGGVAMRPAEFGRLPTAIIVPDGCDGIHWRGSPLTCETFGRLPPTVGSSSCLSRNNSSVVLPCQTCSAWKVYVLAYLGEALTHARGRASILDLPTSAYSATLSYAISRAIALTRGAFPVEGVVRLWVQAREVTGQNGLGVPPNMILSVWSVALRDPQYPAQSRTLFEPTNILSAAWTELSSTGEISDPVWHRLVDGFPDLDRMRSLIEVPREQRVQAIDVALRMLLSTKRGDEDRRGFLAGYFTSLLGPGTLDHADFLASVAGTFPTAYLWYGLFAGANPRGDALPVGNPLARRIVRDLTLSDRVLDRPRCDVALDELAIHSVVDNLLKQTAKAGRLDIDLLPGVTTSVRWPPYKVPGEEEMRRARDIETQQVLAQLDEVTAHTRHLTERLRDLLRLGDGDRQQGSKRKRGTKS